MTCRNSTAWRDFVIRQPYVRLVDGIRYLPCRLVVEESIRPLLVVFCYRLWLFVSLEPCLILLVESPALRLECFRCQVLLVCTLAIVEGIEESVGLDPGV